MSTTVAAAVPLAVHGPTLSLRLATEHDAPRLLELGSDPQVTRFFSWGPYSTLAEPRAYIGALEARREAGDLLDLLIDHHEHGPIGVTGLSELSRRNRHATVGSWLGRAWWGTGANTEAKSLIVRLAFERLGMDRVTAWANVTNGRSQAALTKVGFVREGVLRSWHRHGEQLHDVAAFGMLPEDFLASPLATIAGRIEGQPPAPWVVGPLRAAVPTRPADLPS